MVDTDFTEPVWEAVIRKRPTADSRPWSVVCGWFVPQIPARVFLLAWDGHDTHKQSPIPRLAEQRFRNDLAWNACFSCGGWRRCFLLLRAGVCIVIPAAAPRPPPGPRTDVQAPADDLLHAHLCNLGPRSVSPDSCPDPGEV